MKSIGPGCEIYLKDIKRLLVSDEPMRRRCGLYALQGMGDAGKSAMQEIISCVSDMDLNNQCSACRVLESYGTDAIDAEEALLKLFNEGGPSTRGWAAVCLGAIGPTSSDVNVAELLTERLANNANARPLTPTEQERILIGLAHLGPEASGAVDVVLEKMNGKNKYVSGHAAYAHWKITGDSTKALAKLKELLAISHHQSDAMFLISKMGPEAASLAKGVGRGLGSAEAGTREQASIALGNMGASANEFLDELENRKKDKDALVRVAARRAIAQIKDDVKELEEKKAAKPNKG
jgi:HEAT repeat protein